MNFDLKTLVEKLNPVCRKALETAASLCVGQTHYNVELEHLFIKLLEQPDTDIHHLLKYYEVKPENVLRELTQAMDRFKRGNSRTPALSPHVMELVQGAWTIASLHLNIPIIRSGALLMAIYENEAIRALMMESSGSLIRIPRELMRKDMREIIRRSAEETDPRAVAGEAAFAEGNGETLSRPGSTTPSLDQYTHDLTAQARSGKIDPILGRDFEIRQIIDILTRRRQNNPILTGEAGVGKTAVVEGFALRVAEGTVPPSLQSIAVRVLDLGLLQAGAGVKGEFENRLKSVINEVKKSAQPIILFIDEAHTMIGAGGQAGQNDAANLLKPALARGELRTIAATTWAEYKKYFEKDPALTRRFQVIKVEEPDEETAVTMLRGVVENLEKHHGVRILDEAVNDGVRLSHRYITGRQLPDKAISVLDTACARVSIAQNDVPPVIEDIIRRIQQIAIELPILQRENLAEGLHGDRISGLKEESERLKKSQAELEERWKNELAAVKKYQEFQKELEELSAQKSHDMTNLAKEDLESLELLNWEIERVKQELASIQQDEPMIPVCVDSKVIADVISGWTGIPVGKMLSDEIRTVLNLKEKMAERVVGQDQALTMIARRIQTSRADLMDPGKPMGVFLLVGPSGVGKTETAVTLADILFGGERNMVSVNMSEYQEAHTVSSLKGSPPGYVGYGTGGVLTEAVRRNPYSVVLLDEVEKAHPDVMELFYQVFDKGILEDGEGVPVNFRNTIIILTSNIGTEMLMTLYSEPDNQPESDAVVDYLRPELVKVFKPALLGRMVVVPYAPLSDEVMREIVKLKLGTIQRRFRENHRAEMTYDESIVDAITQRCTEVDSGARAVDNILTNTLLPQLSGEILERMVQAESFSMVHIGMEENGSFYCTFDGSTAKIQRRTFSMS